MIQKNVTKKNIKNMKKNIKEKQKNNDDKQKLEKHQSD